MAQYYPSSIGNNGTSLYQGDLTAGQVALRSTNTAATSGGISGSNKLWLPLWSGEVIHAYDQYNMFENLINTKTIAGGFAYEFPITGTVDLEPAWNAGQELFGTGGTSRTIKVALDARPMAAHFETDNIDLLVTQWDYRSELARQAGLQLANTRDRQIAMGLVAASALDAVSGDPRGLASAAFHVPGIVGTSNTYTAAGCTEAEALKVLQEIENYLVTCQENDVAVVDVYCAVTPKVFQVIRALGIPRTMSNNVNASYGQLFGGGDDWKAGQPLNVGMNVMADTLEYMGVKIVKTNHLPKKDHNSTDSTVGGGLIGNSKYNLNAYTTSFSNATAQGFTDFSIYGVIFQKEALAGLSLQGMKVDTVQDVRRNTQFTVASMLKGTGVVRPELCKLLIGASAGSATRTVLRAHLNGNGGTGVGAAPGNLTAGFGGEYANISSSSY